MGHAVPLLTIVTVTYNLISAGREKRFRQCVESVHSQSCLSQIEHLVVDSESNDGTAELLKGYADRGYFKVISKKDRSVYEGMNNGLAEARGTYVLFLNSDDFLFNTDGLGAALDELETSGADYCFGDVRVLKEEDSAVSVWQGSTGGLPFAHNYCHQSMIAKTEVLRRFGGFDLRYRVSSDSDLMMRLYHDRNPFIHSSSMFACYRLGGLSTGKSDDSQRDHADVFYRYFGKDCGLTPEQCLQVWHFRAIEDGLEDMALDILVKLPEFEWRAWWLTRMKQRAEERRRAARPIWKKVYDKWREQGVRGVVTAVGKRFQGGDVRE